ncbi:MAG: ABC transporter ATP-binding protein [Alphaproteobacteria bacterium]
MEKTPFKFLWHYAKKLKAYVFWTIGILAFSDLFLRIGFFYGSRIVDVVLKTENKEAAFYQALKLTFLLGVFMLASGIIRNFLTNVQAKYQPYYILLVSKDLFSYVHKHSPAFFIEEMSGRIGSKINNIINACYRSYFDITFGVVNTSLCLLITIAFLVKINFYMALILTVYMALFVLVIVKISKEISYYSEKYANANSKANGILIDSFTNVLEVKNFGTYNFEKRNYFKALKKVREADKQEILKYAKLFYIQAFMQKFSLVMFWFLPLIYWYKGMITTADFVFVGVLVNELQGMLNIVGFQTVNLFKLRGEIGDALKLLARSHDIKDAIDAKKLKVEKGNIEFSKVTFNYKKTEPLFDNLNVKIEAGEKVGLVGRSGSGKSSFIKLLSRYYDIQKGQILIDGVDIKEVTQESLHKNIAIIPQDITLFNRPLIENIRYGNIKASDEEVFKASKKAYVDDFINKLPDKYETFVGERGVMLSGGQRQRIAIARAILKNAPILILDEATSSLDSESEQYIQKSIKSLMRNKTVLAIAHRLSTLREMNRILVYDDGRIVEEGTHRDLIKKNGIYSTLWDMQSGEFVS